MERVKNAARKALKVWALVCGSALFLTGCIGEAGELTDDNVEQVSQYAVPIKITTLAQLRAMNLTGTYELGNNINASATSTTAFVPIGTSAAPFKGTFDGKGFTISNLTIAGNRHHAGMFGYAQAANIYNFKLTNVKLANTSTYNHNGAVVGNMTDTSVSDVEVTGTVSGGMYTGGLVGYSSASYISGGGPRGVNVTGTSYVGGAVGLMSGNSYVINAISTGGSVTGGDQTGGFVGRAVNSTVSYSSATGLNVTGTTNTGGFAGFLSGAFMVYDAAAGAVKGTNKTGGLVGTMFDGQIVSGSAVNITVTGASGTGGLGGEMSRSSVTASFVRGDVTGTTNTGGLIGSIGGSLASRAYVTGSYIDNKPNNSISTVQGTTPVGMAIGLVKPYVDVKRSYAMGKVSGASNTIGGFMGEINAPGMTDVAMGIEPRADVQEIFTKVEVAPTFDGSNTGVYAGGLVGKVLGATIYNVNVAGSVKGRHYVGGAIGYAINSGSNVTASIVRSVLTRGEVTNVAVSNRSGLIGGASAAFVRCDINYWDTTTDSGTAVTIPDADPYCQFPRTSTELKSPERVWVDPQHPNGNYDIFIYGELIDHEYQNEWGAPDCSLGSGSDGDFGFGFCDGIVPGAVTPIWVLNSASEYNTLLHIPNPERQPKN